MSKLSFKCFLESEGIVIGEGMFDFLKKKDPKKDSKFLTTKDGVIVLDSNDEKIPKDSLSDAAADRAIARFLADKKDPSKGKTSKSRSERQANDQLSDTADFNKKVKATLGAKSR